jgi:hypothetical protein
MATKSPLPHVVRASALAHDLFTPKDDAPPAGSLYKNVTLSVPLGLLSALDVLARRAGQSRSATAAQLMECGFGLVMQQLSPSKLSALRAELEAAHIDTSGYLAPSDGSATVVAVEG